MSTDRTPLRIINSVAPIRICDNGGWTDTWFAEHGKVFNIAVSPYAEVQVAVFDRSEDFPQVILNAENYGDRYAPVMGTTDWGEHKLLEAAIHYVGVPDDMAIEITLFSHAPSGCSTGTSAAVSVALIGAVDALTPTRMTAHEVAAAAQRVETDLLKQQCGIQDQLASAYGGINFIDMTHYPAASVSPLPVPPSTWWELNRRMFLIFLGKSHSSSQIHEMVIRDLEDAGPENPKLNALRRTAERSRDALLSNDLEELGRAMIDNTDAQVALHPNLVGSDAQAVINVAKKFGAVGYKVNGAGGEGGSVSILAPKSAARAREMLQEIEGINSSYLNIPILLSQYGLHVWES